MEFDALLILLTDPFTKVPAWNWALQGIGVIASYIGADLNSRGKVEGFAVWMVSNVFMAILHFATDLWIVLILDVLFFRLNLRGWRNWKKSPPLQPAAGPAPQSTTTS